MLFCGELQPHCVMTELALLWPWLCQSAEANSQAAEKLLCPFDSQEPPSMGPNLSFSVQVVEPDGAWCAVWGM